MRQALILALQEYNGAVVIISHDRHLIRATTDELYLVYQGKVAPFDGSIDDYPLRWKLEQKNLFINLRYDLSKTTTNEYKRNIRIHIVA